MTYICKSGMYAFSLTGIYYDDWLVAEVLSCMLEFRGFTKAWKFPCFPPAAGTRSTRSTSRHVRSTSSTTSTAHHRPLHRPHQLENVTLLLCRKLDSSFSPSFEMQGCKKNDKYELCKSWKCARNTAPTWVSSFLMREANLANLTSVSFLLWVFLYPSLLRLNLGQIGNLISQISPFKKL